jgi:formiminotetrahydrofolate cyclodeaminase
MVFKNQTVEMYINELASARAIPGGGSAAALTASMGIALCMMVARITAAKVTGKKKDELTEYVKQLNTLRKKAERTIDRDPRVYGKLSCAYSLPKTHPQRSCRIAAGLEASCAIMCELAEIIRAALLLQKRIVSCASGALANDLVVSDALLRAAHRAAVTTARVNIDYMKDPCTHRACTARLRRVMI